MTESGTAERGDAGVILDMALAADPSAAKTARDAVRAAMDRHDWSQWPDWSDGDVLDDVMLIVSELVSNAVQHGRPEIRLRVRGEPLAVDLSVLDHGSDLPARDPRHPDQSAVSGRGLAIVNSLAESWGIAPLPDAHGKAVWAILRHAQ